MVLLVKIQESAIVENLKKRFFDDLIFVSSKKNNNPTTINIEGTYLVEVDYVVMYVS